MIQTLNAIVDFIRNYKETGQLNFEDLRLENVITKSEMENELYEDFLNMILVHAPKITSMTSWVALMTPSRLQIDWNVYLQIIDGTIWSREQKFTNYILFI